MGGKPASDWTGPDSSPLGAAVDLARRERRRWLFAGSIDSVDLSRAAAALIGDAGKGETARLVDTLLLASIPLASHVIDVRGENAETVLAPAVGAQTRPQYACPPAPTSGAGTPASYGSAGSLPATGSTPTGLRSRPPKTADGPTAGRWMLYDTDAESRPLVSAWRPAENSAYRITHSSLSGDDSESQPVRPAVATDPDS
jgi:hypothetical protein